MRCGLIGKRREAGGAHVVCLSSNPSNVTSRNLSAEDAADLSIWVKSAARLELVRRVASRDEVARCSK